MMTSWTGLLRMRRDGAGWLPALFLLATAARLMAGDFRCTTNGSTVTITGYSGTNTAVVIPSMLGDKTVISIGNSSFLGSSWLVSVTIPQGVTNIGDYAFYSCSGLTNVAIPDSVTVIGDCALEYCSGLTSVTMPTNVTSIGFSAFEGCTSLTNAAIPASVTSIGYGAFSGCRLDRVTIPEGITDIKNYTFNGCSSLTNVSIPASVTNIGLSAFAGCGLTRVTIPDRVGNIGDSAFYACTNLTSVMIPASVANVGDSAFQSCTRLKGVYFKGHAPSGHSSAFYFDDLATVYCLPGTTNWGPTFGFGGPPVVLWNPHVPAGDAGFGVRTNRFGFTIAGSPNLVIVVEACTNLAGGGWVAVQTNTLTGGSCYFSEPEWPDLRGRFYRFNAP